MIFIRSLLLLYREEVVTYRGDMTYIIACKITFIICVCRLCVGYVRAYVCLKFKISLLISQGYTNARQLYENEKAARLLFNDCKRQMLTKNNGTNYSAFTH